MPSYPPSQPDWCNLSVIHRGTLPPRAAFFNYSSPQKALSYIATESETISLNGTWKFSHSTSPFEAVPDFEKPGFDYSAWEDVKVPGMWQLQGFGKPAYSNVDYPFPVDPPFGMFCSMSRFSLREKVVSFDCGMNWRADLM